MSMETLKEISNQFAKTQPEMVDRITEESPILDALKWTASTHSAWNLAETVDDIQGAGFTQLNAPLPEMNLTENLEYVSLFNLGGTLTVPEDKATISGGAPKYFAKRQDAFLKDAGNATEKNLFEKYFLSAAMQEKLVISAGGTAASSGATGLSSMVVMRMDEDSCVGLYDSTQFSQGSLLTVKALNGGNLYTLKNDVHGYGVRYLGRFGWQILDPKRTVHAIANISKTKLPTLTMIDEAISNVRGRPGNTLIMSDVLTLTRIFPSEKLKQLTITNGERSINTMVTDYNGIKIIGSYNIENGNRALYSA